MIDNRLVKLSHNLINYSCELKKGEKVIIEIFGPHYDFARQLVHEAHKVRALPVVWLRDSSILREQMIGGTKEQWDYIASSDAQMLKEADAYIGVRGGDNSSQYSDISAEQLKLHTTCYNTPVHSKIRVLAPLNDMKELLKEEGLSLFTLETKTPVSEFDILGFSLQYEMSYTNVLYMLDLADIPLHSANRDKSHPLVIAGGPCTCNPEPISPFIDAFLIGEGEQTTLEIIEMYRKYKDEDREVLLKHLSKIEGVYVPSLYDVVDNIVTPKSSDIPKEIVRRIIEDLDSAPWPEKIIVPWTEIVHDRINLELFRGCTRGCRFCQAGMIYRPIRERKADTLVKHAINALEDTGYDEMSLMSLSTGDYSNLEELILELLKHTSQCRTTLSVPSLRLDAHADVYMKAMESERKSGLTLAPEAGSQRLRDVINKNVTEDDLITSVNNAFNAGWDRVKLYFMIGLPTETYEDIDGIVDLAIKVKEEYLKMPKEKRRRKVKIVVSVAGFVPKPHTPFQWVKQDDFQTLKEKQWYLRDKLKSKGIKFNYHDAAVTRIEAVFARGDRNIANVLLRAYELGCVFDGWSEHFKYSTWLKAFDEVNINPDDYGVRAREIDEPMPWDHIKSGVYKRFLADQYSKALKAITTDDCRDYCFRCGIGEIAKGIKQCVL